MNYDEYMKLIEIFKTLYKEKNTSFEKRTEFFPSEMRKESESRGGQEEEDEREEFYLFRAFLGRREREREIG